jgi:hypothetical protein
MCYLNPILLISLQGELSLQHFHTMEDGTTQVIIGASSWPTKEVTTTTNNLQTISQKDFLS